MEADYEFKKRIERFTTGVLIGGKGSSDLEEHRGEFRDDFKQYIHGSHQSIC